MQELALTPVSETGLNEYQRLLMNTFFTHDTFFNTYCVNKCENDKMYGWMYVCVCVCTCMIFLSRRTFVQVRVHKTITYLTSFTKNLSSMITKFALTKFTVPFIVRPIRQARGNYWTLFQCSHLIVLSPLKCFIYPFSSGLLHLSKRIVGPAQVNDMGVNLVLPHQNNLQQSANHVHNSWGVLYTYLRQ